MDDQLKLATLDQEEKWERDKNCNKVPQLNGLFALINGFWNDYYFY